MWKNVIFNCLLVLVLSNVKEIHCGLSRCVVVAPRSIRSNSDYALSIATHGAIEPLQFRIKIYEREEPRINRTVEFRPNKKGSYNDPVDWAAKRGPKPKLMKKINDDKFSRDVTVPVTGIKTKTITVQPNLPQIVKFRFDRDLQPGSYVLEVVSLSSSADAAFYEKQHLSVESATFSIFIHTNKASYRPADIIKYRIITIDADTRPVAIDSSLTVNIYDSSRTLVHMKTKQTAKNGVYAGEYQIPTRAMKGVWEIEAEFKDTRIRKQFEITNVERPNFQVIVRGPNFVSNSSTQFSVGVECFYTFGKPVTAMAVIKATPIFQSNSSWPESGQSVTITKDVRGTYLITFQMADFKIPVLRTWDSILVETTMLEKATGRVMRGQDKTIPIDYKRIPSKYDILLYYFGFFLAGQMFSIKVHVYAKSGVALPADMQSVKFAVAFDSDLSDALTFNTYELDANGKTELMVQIPSTTVSKIHFKVKHGESFEEGTVLAKKLHVQVINPSTPKLNQKLQFQVGSRDALQKLSYFIVGRGTILVSQVVDMAGKNMGMFEFDSTLTMTPSSSLVVYYVTDAGDIISDETEFLFEPELLAHPLTVTVSETRLKPNQELTVTMTSGENSFVTLTGMDQNVLLENQGNDLSRNKVYNALRLFDNSGDLDLDASYTDLFSKLLKPGTIVMTDAMKFKPGTLASNNLTTIRRDINYDYTADIQTNIVIPLQPICSYINLTIQEQLNLQNTSTVRSNFIDTLLWQNIDSANGTTTLKTTVPDTVTSWALIGYSLSTTTGLGLMQTPLVLTTFKPFFTDIRVPSSFKMGEVALIQVAVYNYMDQLSRVEVTLDDTAGDFDIVPSGRAFTDYTEYDENFEQRNLKLATFQVVGDGVRSTTFSVRPKKTGSMKLKVQTISRVACDTVEKIVIVEPPGKTITRKITRQIFLNPGQPLTNSSFVIDMPPNAVPGSEKVQVSVQGDKYSLDLTNQQPLKTNDLDVLSSIISQGLNLIGPAASQGCSSSATYNDVAMGVNNFLRSQCSEGGFRMDSDCDQSTRDTSYTAKTLLTAAGSLKYIPGNDLVVSKGYDWLARIQRPDGSFPDPNPFSPLFAEGPVTTSYVLYSYLTASADVPEIKTKYAATLSKGFDNLFAQLESLNVLSLAYLSRAAQMYQDTRKSTALRRLTGLSFKNELTQRWTRSALLDEALPYILEFYQDEEDIATKYRVGNGYTQYMVDYIDQFTAIHRNQIIGRLDYFKAATSTLTSTSYQMTVAFSSSSNVSGPSSAPTSISFDSSNRFLQSTYELDAKTKVVNVMAQGSGLATVEVVYEYNLMPDDVVDAYSLQLNLTSAMSKEWQLNVCVGAKLTPYPTVSVMEVNFPPGFNTSEYVQDIDAMTPKKKKKDLKGSTMIVHFEGLDNKLACFDVPLYRSRYCEQPLVGTVTIQDQDPQKPHISSAEYTLPSYDSTEII